VTKKPLPKDIIEQWPEIFNDIDVKIVPIIYLHSMRIVFTEGKIWNFEISNKSRSSEELEDLESQLYELIDTYEDVIEHIDFRLDVAKVKKDIIAKTKKFLKKPRK